MLMMFIMLLLVDSYFDDICHGIWVDMLFIIVAYCYWAIMVNELGCLCYAHEKWNIAFLTFQVYYLLPFIFERNKQIKSFYSILLF